MAKYSVSRANVSHILTNYGDDCASNIYILCVGIRKDGKRMVDALSSKNYLKVKMLNKGI